MFLHALIMLSYFPIIFLHTVPERNIIEGCRDGLPEWSKLPQWLRPLSIPNMIDNNSMLRKKNSSKTGLSGVYTQEGVSKTRQSEQTFTQAASVFSKQTKVVRVQFGD